MSRTLLHVCRGDPRGRPIIAGGYKTRPYMGLFVMTMLFLFLFPRPVFATNTGPFTISVWVNPTTSIASKAIITKAEELRLVTDASGNPLCQFKTTTWQTSATKSSPIPLNQWSHIVCTYDLTKLTVYVNGVAGTPISLTAVPDDTSAVFYAGRDVSASTTYGFFTGLIDDFKFYNYNLSLDEILVDYNRGSALVLGSLSTGNSNPAPNSAGSQEYCIPGDTGTNCSPPVGRWDFNEGVGTSAFDTSGNGNNGGLGTGGSSPTWTAGKIGKGLRFDGVDDYVGKVSTASLVIANQITLESWVNPDQSNKLGGIVTKSSWQEYAMSFATNKIRFESTNISEYSNSTIPINKWTHAVITYDGQNVRFYINGILDATKPDPDGLTVGLGEFDIGKKASVNTWNFSGLIDQVRIYNYARTPAQIAWDYNKGGPTLYFDFDECQGTVLKDRIGVGVTATVTIGSGGTQTTAGTCSIGIGSTVAWGNGSSGKYNASLNFDGTDDFVNVGVGLTVQSISLWIKPTSNTTSLMQLAAGVGVTASSGVISAPGFTSPSIYVNGILISSISQISLIQNTWSHIVVTTATGIPATAIKFGLFGTSYYSGQIDEAKLWNYQLTAVQIKTLYNQAAAVRFGQ